MSAARHGRRQALEGETELQVLEDLPLEAPGEDTGALSSDAGARRRAGHDRASQTGVVAQLRIIGTDPPGRGCGDHTNVHVGIQHRRNPDQVVPADTEPVVLTAEITVIEGDDTIDVRGPCVQGRPGDRFVYLTWGEADANGTFEMFRRAKLMLDAIDHATLAAARRDGYVLEARLGLTDECGLPRCAAVRPPTVTWTATRR